MKLVYRVMDKPKVEEVHQRVPMMVMEVQVRKDRTQSDHTRNQNRKKQKRVV